MTLLQFFLELAGDGPKGGGGWTWGGGETKAVNSTSSTHSTCIVPNKQFCPHNGVAQYTLHNIAHCIHHKVWWGALTAQCKDPNLIPSIILRGS